MKIRILLISMIITFFLTSCREGYKVEEGKVYYESWNEGSGHNKSLIEHADANTFKTLKYNYDFGFDIGKDKTHLFINMTPIKGIDPNSFNFIGNYIFRDKDSAYFFGFYNNINNCAIKGIELDKLQLIKYPWAKSQNILIHGHDTLTLNDIEDFKPIDEDWGKTKKYVIYENGILKDADPESFIVINNYSGKDKSHKYEFGEIKE